MSKRKRKGLGLSSKRSAKKQAKLKTIEPNNNYTNETGDTILASHIEINSTSNMIEQNTKVITKHTDRASTELAIERTEINDCSASEASDISIGDLLAKIDLRIAQLEQNKNPVKSESIEMSNNPGYDTDISLASRVKTDSTPKIVKPKAKRKSKEKLQEELVLQSTEIVIDDSSINKTEDMPSNTVNPTEDIGCKPEDTPQIKLMIPVPIAIAENPECKNAVIPEVGTNLISMISKPKAQCTVKSRCRKQRKIIKSKAIILDDDLTSETGIVSVDSSCTKINSISGIAKLNEKRAHKPGSTQQETPNTSEPVEINDNHGCENKDASSAIQVETDSVPIISEPKAKDTIKSRCRRQRKIIKSKAIILGDDLTSETGIVSVDSSCTEINLISEKATPNKKGLRKSRSTQQETPNISKLVEINNNPECENKDASSAIQVETGSVPIIPEPKAKDTLKPRCRKPRKINKSKAIILGDDLTSETGIISVDSSCTKIDSISEKAKPNKKSLPKSRSTQQETSNKSEPVEMNNNPKCENKDTSSATQEQTDAIPETTKPKIERTRKSRAKIAEVVIKPDAMNTTCYLVNETKHTPPENETISESITMSEFKPGRKRARGRPPQKLMELKKIETNLNVIDTKRTDDHTPETNLSYSIPETIKNKYPLLDTMYQPKVLLRNIAYCDELSSEQKRMLLKSNQSQKSLSMKIVPYSSTNQIVDKSTSHDVIVASSKIAKRNDEPVRGASSTKACKNSNTRKHRVRKNKKIRTEFKVLSIKNWDKIYAAKLSVRGPEPNSENTNEMDVLSSIENEDFSITKKRSPLTELSLEDGSLTLTQHNDFGKKLIESIVPPAEKEIVMCPSPEMIELEIPLDLSIRHSENSISNKSDICKPGDNSFRDICFGITEHQSRNTNVHDVGFGSSTFHVTNLSESFTEITASVDATVLESSKPNEEIDIRENPTLQKFEHRDENLTFHKPLMTPTASKSITKRASKNQLKLPYSDTLSFKVSIPAKHYFNKRLTARKSSETVVEQEKLALQKARTKFETDCKKIDHQRNENVTQEISNEKRSEANLMTAEPAISTEEIEDQNVELPYILPGMCRLDDTNANCQTAFEPSSSGPVLNPTITNVRSLPKIVIDEILPKGTITLSSVSCKPHMTHMFAAKMGNDHLYSTNINEFDENHRTRELTIHTQSTYTSIVNQNVSQLQTTTHCSNQAHASADTGNVNFGNDIVDYFQKSENPHSIGSNEFTESMQSNVDNRNFADIGQTFDSTQLWKICPELKNYFGHDDVINNNNNNNTNEERLSNFEKLNTVETNFNNNTIHTLPTEIKIETESNSNNSMELPSNNFTLATENANNLPDVCEGTIAMNVNCNEMGMESSESIAINTESNSIKSPVIADLTSTNLRNFNIISNYQCKSELKWSAETCQYFSSHENIVRHSNKSTPNSFIEISEATESTFESQREFSQTGFKKRKRKWIKDEKNVNLKAEIGVKRLKLNRNKWSTERRDFRDIINSQRPTLVESINSDNSGTSNIESTQSPKKSSHADVIVVRGGIKNELNVTAERTEVIQGIFNLTSEEPDQNCTMTNEKENIDNLTSIPVRTMDPGTSKCNIRNDSRLLGELCIPLSKNSQNDCSDSSVDGNDKLTSMSSSSSSFSQSSDSISILGKSTHSNNSERSHPVQDDAKLDENKFEQREEVGDDTDADCISLFAESMFTNVDQATNIMDVINYSPVFDRTKDSDEKFQDMADVGAYFDKNIQECNEAYASCVQEDKDMHDNDNSHIVPNASTNENHSRIIPQLLELNTNQLNSSQSMQSFGTQPYPVATIFQESNFMNRENLKDKLGVEKEVVFSNYVVTLFDWHCFQKLKRGSCNREGCRFYHKLTAPLRNLKYKDPELINEIINYAIFQGYNYFICHVYPDIITQMDYPNIIKLFYKLASKDLMKVYLVKNTITAVINAGISLQKFLSDIAHLLNVNDDNITNCILIGASSSIEPGAFWDTCRAFLIKIKPSFRIICSVISDCIYNNNKLQIQDVYKNFVKKLTAEQLSNININLREKFHALLVENDLIREVEHSGQLPAVFENVNLGDKTLEVNNVTENYHRDSIKIPTILSPDDIAHYNYDNVSQLSPRHEQLNQKFSSQGPSVVQSLTKNQDIGSDSAAKSHSFLNRRTSSGTQISFGVKQYSPDLNTSTSKSGIVNWSSFKLHRIDDLPSPRSAYRDRHWKFHLDMNNLKEALKHEEYSLALKVLNEYSDADQTIFLSSCYKMLLQNVMASAHHVRNMIKLSVWMGVNKFLSETLFTLGMYMMIELCNVNAWVLAYSLFKALHSASLTEKVAEFALISAEICIANRRPLKAFIILKQNNMFCTNRSKWNVISNPNDEHVRVMIINLLLDVLCQEYPNWAFYIFTYLLEDQARIYHPIDLTAYIDKLVTGILSRNSRDLITDVGRLIIEYNFTLENSVFQSLVINIFEMDIALCRQLYRYGMWLGVYSIVKLTLPLNILIKTNLTKEEMYLVIMDFLEKLSMDIGPAIDRIGPNQFKIHLVFELAPFKQPLVENNVQICNKDELKMSKELMKTVLRERFNPPLRTIIAEKERFMKLQSRSVVNYLKSMMLQQ